MTYPVSTPASVLGSGGPPDPRWLRLQATASAVRATAPPRPRPAAGSAARRLFAGCIIAGAGLGTTGASAHLRPAAASAPANAELFALTNQDRSSNGVGSLQSNATLAAIGEGLPYRGCGFTVYGRAQDMVNRNYFAHPILGCGQLVFAMMQSNRVAYLSAGENIGWDSGATDAGTSAQYINTQFMNSPEHRANILNRAYTHLGIGSAQSNSWSGAGGGPYPNVWMFSEEFAQLSSGTPSAPTQPAPTTAVPDSTVRAATAPPPSPIRNDPPPAPPAQPPLVTGAPPTAAPSAAAASSLPGGTTGPAQPPMNTLGPPSPQRPGGFLADTVEAVLEAFLVD